MDDKDEDRFFWLITYPRTGSNLLWRMLAKDEQSGFLEGLTEYYFISAMGARNMSGVYTKNVDNWTTEERELMRNAYQGSFARLQASMVKAREENKKLYVKEHSSFMAQPPAISRFFFGDENVKEPAWKVECEPRMDFKYKAESVNDVLIPESVLAMWNPTFLIRHPALVFESIYRVRLAIEGKEQAKSDFASVPLEPTLRWSRTMYDWYLEYFRREKPKNTLWPIVLDADDIISSPELVRRYATLVGMDPAKLKFSWPAGHKTDSMGLPGPAPFMLTALFTTIDASTGIIEGKTSKGLDLSAKVLEWKAEFGGDEALKLEKLVKDAMPDYEFMVARKLTL